MVLYDKDLIASRDEYVKLHSSVVKWWNDSSVIKQMEKQQREYEAMMMASMQQAVNEPQPNASDYNETTGSYSGSYGKNVTLDQDGLDQVASILSERKDPVEELMALMKEEG